MWYIWYKQHRIQSAAFVLLFSREDPTMHFPRRIITLHCEKENICSETSPRRSVLTTWLPVRGGTHTKSLTRSSEHDSFCGNRSLIFFWLCSFPAFTTDSHVPGRYSNHDKNTVVDQTLNARDQQWRLPGHNAHSRQHVGFSYQKLATESIGVSQLQGIWQKKTMKNTRKISLRASDPQSAAWF